MQKPIHIKIRCFFLFEYTYGDKCTHTQTPDHTTLAYTHTNIHTHSFARSHKRSRRGANETERWQNKYRVRSASHTRPIFSSNRHFKRTFDNKSIEKDEKTNDVVNNEYIIMLKHTPGGEGWRRERKPNLLVENLIGVVRQISCYCVRTYEYREIIAKYVFVCVCFVYSLPLGRLFD